MKINSELPLCMLDQNNDLNEYDFVLFHLYLNDKTYREFCWRQRLEHPDRLMILDNSAYEFYIKGETLDTEQFVKVINELQPDYYILPDTLMNFQKTYNDTKSFLEKYNITCSKSMAVIQGNTENELLACVLLYQDLGIDGIAIPFHNSFFKEYSTASACWAHRQLLNTYQIPFKWGNTTESLNEDMKYAAGRIQWISEYRTYLNFKHVHILGSHCPAEKIYYKEIPVIKTMDTGYPVKCAMEGYELFKEPHKPNIIIDDFLNDDLSKDKRDLITKNVTKFRLL